MSSKQGGTDRLRNNYSQTKYRKESSSQNKDKQHVAHITDLSLVNHISQHSKGKESTDSLKQVFNSSDNYRMVKKSTNLSTHKEIEKSLIQKSQNGEKLTQAEERRARQQVEVMKNSKNDLPDGFLKGSEDFFKSLNTQDGKTLWDGRSFK